MSSTLALSTVRAAQSKDLQATTAVIEATESRIAVLARKAARRMAESGPRHDDYFDEFTQQGRIAVWEALARFDETVNPDFLGFAYTTVETMLLGATRAERNQGVDDSAAKTFLSMLDRAGGDPFLAEKLCQSVPPAGRRLSSDRAHAARLAYQGADSLDAPAPGSTDDEPWEPGTSTYGVPEDLITPDDVSREEARIKKALVHGILDVMGEGQAYVLRATFGIEPVPYYGNGADEGLAASMNSTAKAVREARSKGLKSFGKRWINATAQTPEEVNELTAAMNTRLTRKGAVASRV
ncbi:hypothetical protein H9Y04_18355 [Streptomyces sp. TRM66268-LWL]|uniref:RNA polymerase sigma-70 region 2 domain-containing protein n=1 Tax=Streptomyces polyasparticus TaxID=2767826 RepID=A0ABR7SJM7_9ACTN|nr:sigma factor [Streptomyces polyasparticus]MBC9714523.1 hypothetical protein [Streptomyces polyasparticus]